MKIKTLALFALTGSLFASNAATLIDFEAQGSGAASTFSSPTPNSPIKIGTATFTGGELLFNESFSIDTSAVYATTLFGTGSGFTNPLVITFAAPVKGFSLSVENGEDASTSYTVSDNLGGSVVESLGTTDTPSSLATFALSDSGITSVRILSADSANYTFAIDNVSFTVVTPEPASGLLIFSGIAFLALARKFWKNTSLAA